MRAMVLDVPQRPLRLVSMERPSPGPGELLLRIRACGVCRTDLHLIDGELPDPKLPVVPGHEIVAEVMRVEEPPLSWDVRGRCSYAATFDYVSD